MRFRHVAWSIALAIAATAPVSAQEKVRIDVCVVDEGRLTNVQVAYDTQTGDTTTADGTAFSEAYSSSDDGYAAQKSWFIDNEPIVVRGETYLKYGLPRVLYPSEVVPFDAYDDVPLYVEAGADAGVPEVLYLSVRPGCEVQPYQIAGEYDDDWNDEDDDPYSRMPEVSAIGYGETLVGTLGEDDAMLVDDSYYDIYAFEGTAGERVRITLRSNDFDAYLSYGYWETDFLDAIESDDDGGGDLDARLEVTLPDSGMFGINVNSLSPGETGEYTITLERL